MRGGHLLSGNFTLVIKSVITAHLAWEGGELMSAGEAFLRVRDVQAYLSISKSSAYELCNGRLFPVRRIGKVLLVKKADLDAYLDKCMA